MNLKASHGRKVPILIWEEKRAIRIAITYLPPRRAAHADWDDSLLSWRYRRRFVFLNRPQPL